MTKRVEYIDAMRGFTMLLVVFAHIETFSFFNFGHETTIGHLLESIMMPLFFFTSGLVTHRNGKTWNWGSCVREGLRKTQILLTPTLFFGILYTLIILGETPLDFFAEPAKNGYWFTITLLEILILYFIVSTIVYKSRKSIDTTLLTILLISVSIIALVLKLPLKTITILKTFGDYSCLHFTCLHLQFFSLGILASARGDITEKILSSKGLIAFTITAFIALFYLRFFLLKSFNLSGINFIIIDTILEVITGHLGIITIFNFFRKYQSKFSSENKIGKSLQFIGKRTLDIYMLHYFLLFPIPYIGNFLIEHPNPIIELLCAGGISLATTCICIIISNVLRTSDFLAHWLLGVKHKS